jgi:hypothetical protein
MSRNKPVLSRLLRTALLSTVATAMLLAYQWSQSAAPHAATTAASPEMMRLLRDEHGLVAAMLEAHLAAEKKELAVDGAARPAAAAGASLR